MPCSLPWLSTVILGTLGHFSHSANNVACGLQSSSPFFISPSHWMMFEFMCMTYLSGCMVSWLVHVAFISPLLQHPTPVVTSELCYYLKPLHSPNLKLQHCLDYLYLVIFLLPISATQSLVMNFSQPFSLFYINFGFCSQSSFCYTSLENANSGEEVPTKASLSFHPLHQPVRGNK